MIFSPLLLILIISDIHRPLLVASSSSHKSTHANSHSPSSLSSSPSPTSSHSPIEVLPFSSRINTLAKNQFSNVVNPPESHQTQNSDASTTSLPPLMQDLENDSWFNKQSSPQLIDPKLAEEMITNNVPISEFHSQLMQRKGIASEYNSKKTSSNEKMKTNSAKKLSSDKKILPLVYMSKDHDLDKRTDSLDTQNDTSSNSSDGHEIEKKNELRKEHNYYSRSHQRSPNSRKESPYSSASPILPSSSPTMSSYFNDNYALTEAASNLDHTDSNPYHLFYDRFVNRHNEKYGRNHYYSSTESTLFPVPSISSRSLPGKPVNSSEIDRLVQRLRAQLRPHRFSPEAVTLSTLVTPTSSVGPFVDHLYHGPHQIHSSASITRNRYRPMPTVDDGKDSADSNLENDISIGQSQQMDETTTVAYEEAAQNHGPVYLTSSDHHGGDIHSDLSESFYPSSSPLTATDYGTTQILPSPSSMTAYSKLNDGMLGHVSLTRNPGVEHFAAMHSLSDHGGNESPYKSQNELIQGYYDDAVKNADQFRVGPRPGGYQNYYEYADDIRPAPYGPQNTMKDFMRMVDSVRHVVYKMKPLKGIASKMYRDFTDGVKKRIRSFRGSNDNPPIYHHNTVHYGNGGPIGYAGMGDASSIKPLAAPMTNSDSHDPTSLLLNEYIQQITGNAVAGLQATQATPMAQLSLNMHGTNGLHSLLNHPHHHHHHHHNQLPTMSTLSAMGGMNSGLGQLNGLNGLMRPTMEGSQNDGGNDEEVDESSLIFQLLSGLKLRRAGSMEDVSESEFLRLLRKDLETTYFHPIKEENNNATSAKPTTELLPNVTKNPVHVNNSDRLTSLSRNDQSKFMKSNATMAEDKGKKNWTQEAIEKSEFTQFLEDYFEEAAKSDLVYNLDKDENNKTEVAFKVRKKKTRERREVVVQDGLNLEWPHDNSKNKVNNGVKMINNSNNNKNNSGSNRSKKKKDIMIMPHELQQKDDMKIEKFVKIQANNNGKNLTGSLRGKLVAKRGSFIFGSRLNRPWKKDDDFALGQSVNTNISFGPSSRLKNTYRGLPTAPLNFSSSVSSSTSSSKALLTTSKASLSAIPLEMSSRTWKSSFKTNLTDKIANLQLPLNNKVISRLMSMVSKPVIMSNLKDLKKKSKLFQVSKNEDIKKFYHKMLENTIKDRTRNEKVKSIASSFKPGQNKKDKMVSLATRSAPTTLNPMQLKSNSNRNPRSRPVIGVFIADLDDKKRKKKFRPNHSTMPIIMENNDDKKEINLGGNIPKMLLQILKIQNTPAHIEEQDFGVESNDDDNNNKDENIDDSNSKEYDGKVYPIKSEKIKVNHRPLLLKQKNSYSPTSATKSAFLVPNIKGTLNLPTLSPHVMRAMSKARFYFVPPKVSATETPVTESPLIEEITTDNKPYIVLLVDKKSSILPEIIPTTTTASTAAASSHSDTAIFNGMRNKNLPPFFSSGYFENDHHLKNHADLQQLHNHNFNYGHSLNHFPILSQELFNYQTLYPTIKPASSSMSGRPEITLDLANSLINRNHKNNHSIIQRHNQNSGRRNVYHFNNIIEPITLSPQGWKTFSDHSSSILPIKPTPLFLDDLYLNTLAPNSHHNNHQLHTLTRTTGPWIPRIS